ncbi:MAG: carboxymuconolactone decarboxylase family protein [Blastocatellia bacterium]
MKMFRIGFLVAALTLAGFSSPMASAKVDGKNQSQPAKVSYLEEQAKLRVKATARVSLADESLEAFKGVETFEPAGSNRIPNYVRGLAMIPNAPKQFAQLFKTFVYGGTVAPETKAVMGLRIAQVNVSPYVAVHVTRLLRESQRGTELLNALRAEKLADLKPAEQQALRYAELLTRDVHGITNAEFGKTHAQFNDAQMVELTMVVCFFNYFTRYAEALNLPVEAWAIDPNVKPVIPARAKNRLTEARVALVSDEEMNVAVTTVNAAKDAAAQAGGLGLGIANSQRAMIRVPDLQAAWRNYGAAARANSKIGREIQLHVSFAVSMANGCRYCTLRQVLGLKRLGVDPAKLQAMKKDDSMLSPRELAAVTFTRKLTAKPDSITDADYEALRKEFGDYGALEIVLQTGAFAFMNRFTDNLRLPSEDEAIRVYKEVYGANY